MEKHNLTLSGPGSDLGSTRAVKGVSLAIGAGAVVSKDVEPCTIIGGVPARLIKRRFSEGQAAALPEIAWWDWSHDTLRCALPDVRGLSLDAFIETYRPGTPAPAANTEAAAGE